MPRESYPSLFRARRWAMPFLRPRLDEPLVEPAPAPEAPSWAFARAVDVQAARREHPRAYEAWTPEEAREAAMRVDAGESPEAVAFALGRPPRSVRSVVTKFRRAHAAAQTP